MANDTEQYVDFQLYRYTPSLVAAVIFIVLFALISMYHFYQVARSRSWYFIIFILGGVCEQHPHTTLSVQQAIY